jgi:hypothetical protein
MKRRTFLTTATGVAASTAFPQFSIGKPGKSANSKLNVAFIGSGGWIAQQPYNQGCSEENLVAFCDVDRNLTNIKRDSHFVEKTLTLEKTTDRLWA